MLRLHCCPDLSKPSLTRFLQLRNLHEHSKATAGGEASETVRPGKPKTKKRKKRPQKEPGHVSHDSTLDGVALASEQTLPTATDETSRPADGQQQPKLGKRKGMEQGAPKASREQQDTRSETQPLPATEAGQQEGARKRSKTRTSKREDLGQELGHSREDTMQDGPSLPTAAAAAESEAAPQQSQAGAGRGKVSQRDMQQRLPSNLAQDAAPPAQALEPARKKRSRNKFKQDTEADQSGLSKDVGSAPEIEAPDAVRKKRNRNKFKQSDAASQQALPESSVPKLALQQSLQDDASASRNNAKGHDSAAQHPPEPTHTALQFDKHSEQRPGKQLKGNAAGHKGKAAGLTSESSRDAGKAKSSDATSGSQVARAGVKGQKEVGLLSKMRAKLAGSQFRWLNEQLYTCPGSQAFELMQEQPQLFEQYHEVQILTTFHCSPVNGKLRTLSLPQCIRSIWGQL